jgi:hypothetical protein
MTTGDARLVGTYRLVSVEHTDQEGSVGRPFGDAPIGFMAYTPEGYMFVTMMQADRPAFAAGDILGGTIDERAEAFSSVSSFVGRYRIDGDMVTYELVAATYPNWVGTTQVRHFAFDGRWLVLTTPVLLMEGAPRRATVRLERI